MIRMPAISECAAPKRRDTSGIVGTCCYMRAIKSGRKHRSGCASAKKARSASLVVFRTSCAAQYEICCVNFSLQFRGRIAPRNESHESQIVAVRMESTARLPFRTAPLISGRTLKCIDKHARHVKSGLIHDLAETRRARHVHFGEIVANGVEANEQQTAVEQRLSKRFCDPAIVLGQRLRASQSTRSQVAAHFVALRNPRERIRHRLSADYQNALVAIGNLRDELLRHDAARAVI